MKFSSKKPLTTLDSPARMKKRGLRGIGCLIVATVSLVIFTSACAEGTYPLDYFYEMHYQPSFESQEPPRLMPAPGAVPITGREVPLPTNMSWEEIDSLHNPYSGENVGMGAQLFAINCAVCHGTAGKGDGKVLKTMVEDYGHELNLSKNVNLSILFALPDGRLFTTITNRDLRPDADMTRPRVMPQFEKLLTAEERWMLVNYIKTLRP
ncbi:cytochrome c [SAR202 cluster bacterium AD-804-J14_MRT_500m]|nr:cytochrome c [SAR202 cluster bacterium AD-804-J14_MRT_500m]